MKKLSFILMLIALGSCVGYRTSRLIKISAVNSTDACQIMEHRKKTRDRQAKREAKKNRKKIFYSQSLPAIPSQPKLTETASTIRLEPVISTQNNQPGASALEENGFVIAKDIQAYKIPLVKPIANDISKSKLIEKKNKEAGSIVRVIKKFQESAQSMILVGLAGLAGVGLLRSSEKKSKDISRWARSHPVLARTALVGAQSVATIGGIALGHHLYSQGVAIPDLAYYTVLVVFGGAAAFYPDSIIGKSNPTSSYLRLKMHDVALYTTGAMMTMYAGNHYNLTTGSVEKNQVVYSVPFAGVSDNQISLVKKDFTRYEEPAKPKEERTRQEQVAATVGVSIGFAFLSFFVAALSCAIACSGNEALAIAVFIGGEGLVIGGLVAIIRKIFNMPKRNKKPSATPLPST